MNDYQERWWRQAKPDLEVLQLLEKQHRASCHQLHYLQMATEKLGKAYFWHKGVPPQKSHANFVRFLRSLCSLSGAARANLVTALKFKRYDDLKRWVKLAMPLAYELESLAPDLANDGPNPEYPWPFDAPRFVPAEYDFRLWRNLATGRGRQLMQVIRSAIEQFPVYA